MNANIIGGPLGNLSKPNESRDGLNCSHDHTTQRLQVRPFRPGRAQSKLEQVGDPLQVIAKHVDFNELAALVVPFLGRGDDNKGDRPAYYPVDVMVRILVLKQLYNLSDKQMEHQLLDRMSYHVFAGIRHMGGKHICTSGMVRAAVAMTMMATCFNLKRLTSFLHWGVDAFYITKPSKMQMRLQAEKA